MIKFTFVFMEQKLITAAGTLRLLGFIVLCGITTDIFSQPLQITGATSSALTPQSLIQNIFLGEGVEVSNITYNGDNVAVGYFTGGQGAIGIERGIIMTSGRAQTQGGNLGGDADGSDFASNLNNGGSTQPNLAPLVGALGLNDVSSFSITFIPTSDTLRFRYCFASEEYPEYACSSYNDIFGFFIEGPGFPTATNIALIPNTTLPVTINNLHPANPSPGNPCPPTNAIYYNNNNNSNNQPTYDGFTDVFIAQAIVQPCQSYTITLAIADVGDSAFDSGVFLEAKSFGTGSIRTEVATVSLDGTVSEGCAKGTVTFSLPDPLTTDLPLDYTIFGTAANGVDYEPIPANLFIPAGQNQIVIDIVALEDNLPEGIETVSIDFKKDPCKRDTIHLTIRENGLISPVLRQDTSICASMTPLELDGTLNLPLPPPTIVSNTQNVLVAPIFTAVTSSIFVTGVQPITLDSGVIQSVCINVDHNWVDDLDIFLVSPGGQFIELTTDNGANGDDYTNTCFSPTATNLISFPGPFAPASAAPFTGTFKPEGVWSDLWGGPTNGEWQIQLVDDQFGITGTLLDWTITFEPSYKVNYQWSPIVGLNCPNCPITGATPAQTTEYTLVATDSYGCSVSDSVNVEVKNTLPPPGVLCGNSTASTVTFFWPSLPDALGYEINTGSGWISLQMDTFYTVTGLLPSSVVNAEIRGINSFAECGASIATGACVNCSPPGVTVATTPVTCFGNTDGAVTFTTDNLNPPYSYRVDANSNNTGAFTNLASGNYIGTVTDGLGCDTLVNFTIGTPAQLISNVTVQQNVSCAGGTDGALSVAATGGTVGYTYLWSVGGVTTTTITGISAGTYAVTITDANGCSVTSPGIITQPSALLASSGAQPAQCNGTPTGTLTGTGAGGTAPFTYAWNSGETSANVNNVLPGSYVLTITDSNGCTDTTQITVAQPPLLLVNATNTPATCHNLNDGTATAQPTGGTLPYTFSWSSTPAQTGITATTLLPNTPYTVTVTDANLCTATATTSLQAPAPLTLTITPTTVSCNSGSDGTATVSANGGNGGYLFVWSVPGETDATANNLPTGTYSVTVTDNKGCTATIATVVNQPTALLPTTTVINAKCFGATDGSAKVNVLGGTMPYTYIWSSGQNTQTIENQPGSVYTVTVTDSKNCTVTASATIGQQPQIIPAFTAKNVLCYNGTSGSINTTATGGTPPFNYVWYGPDNFIGLTKDIDSLAAGTYILTITDINGCTLIDEVTLNQPLAPLQLTAPYVSDTVCFDGATGTARVNAQGGTTPYSYLWDDPAGQTTQFAQNLDVDTYRVTVTDGNGCKAIDSTFIYQKNPLFVYVTPHLPRCFNGLDGYASVDFVSYGVDPYDPSLLTYVWSTEPAQTGRVAINLSHSTTYYVTATDEDGCTATQTAPINNQPELTGYFTGVENIDCYGTNTGSAIVNGTGGTEPYTYLWAPTVSSQTDPFAADLRAGTYFVTITDARTCKAITSITLTEPPALENPTTVVDVLCNGASTGSILAAPSGGVPPYAFNWETGSTGIQLNQVPAGMYTITLTDANGCEHIDSSEIQQPLNPITGTTAPTDVTCFGGSDGRLDINAEGGVPPYQYALNNSPFNGSPLQIALKAGTYTPRIQDGNGCIHTLPDVVIGQRPAIAIELGPEVRIELGDNTQLTADVLNAQSPYELTWSDSDSLWLSCLTCNNPFVDSLFQENTFEVFVVDALGCRGESSIKVIVEKPRKIYVPTGFTPNDDNTNDILFVHGQESAKILNFRIFDRWGEMVFEANDFIPNQISTGWDGNFRGQMMMPEVYVWVLEVEYLDGYKEVLHGQTTLIR